MSLEKMFFDLLYTKTEKEMTEYIQNNALLRNPENWQPYGNDPANYSLFENQQSNATGALIEKIMNSIDATLTRQCLVKGKPLSGPKSPQTMDEALSLFSKSELEQYQLNIFADGTLNELNLIVTDEGEGQAPEKFDETLLSLQRGNKNNIKFVQGKFNMGSTGAVVFCGDEKYQLIASRRHPNIPSDTKGDSDYVGFTLVRKHPRTPEERQNTKNTWYECFKFKGEIPKFKFTKPFEIVDGVSNVLFEKGTIIKMYNYDLPNQSKTGSTRATATDSTNSLYNQLNRFLFNPAFPIRVLETRPEAAVLKRANRNLSAIAQGNSHRLKNMPKDEQPIYKSLRNKLYDNSFGTAYIDIFVFEKGKHITSIRGGSAVVYLMNGQVQYSEGQTFISKDLDYKLIKDSMIIAIDCTHLSQEFHDNGFFMANREQLRDSEQTRFFRKKIIEFLKNNSDLDRLNRERAAQRAGSAQTQDFLNTILGKSIKNTALADLFKGDQIGIADASAPSIAELSEKREDVPLNPTPSYMKVGKKTCHSGEKTRQVKSLPLNKTSRFKFEMNATDDFFTRDENQGTLSIQLLNKKKEDKEKGGDTPGDGNTLGDKFTVSETTLSNGSFHISLTPKEDKLQVGDKEFIEIEIKNDDVHFTHLIEVEISEPKKTEKKKRNRPKLQLPPLVMVYRDQDEINNLPDVVSDEEKEAAATWQEMDWTLENGSQKIVKLEPGLDGQPLSSIHINMSSTALHDLMSEEGTSGEKREWVKQQYIAQIYLTSFMTTVSLQRLQLKMNEAEGESILPPSIEEVELATKLIEESAYMTVKLQLNNLKNIQKFDEE